MNRILKHPEFGKSWKAGRARWLPVLMMGLLMAALPAEARTARSADGSVAVAIPEEWMIVAPTEGAVLLLLTDRDENATLTVLREPLAPGPVQTPVRYLFMKLDNFEQSFEIESQSNPIPLLIGDREAARASFTAEIRQPDGSRIDTGFVFSCLLEGRNLYTLVGSSRAQDFDAWQPVMDAIAGSLRIGPPASP